MYPHITATTSYLFSESPVRVGVEAALLGLPRGFRGVVSSRPSALCRLGVVWKMLGVWTFKSHVKFIWITLND